MKKTRDQSEGITWEFCPHCGHAIRGLTSLTVKLDTKGWPKPVKKPKAKK